MGGFHHQKKCQNTFFGNTQEKGGGCFHRVLTSIQKDYLPSTTYSKADRSKWASVSTFYLLFLSFCKADRMGSIHSDRVKRTE
jgi:hypothetical protein